MSQETSEIVRSIVALHLDLPPDDLKPETRFDSAEVDCDDVDMVMIVVLLEQHFDIEINDDDVDGKVHTVADLTDVVANALKAKEAA